ncbi:hypothetical protein CSHISOI_10890 [Colletotrichum shisoi]|uniref:Aminoglycoside phosphotransferase domain-containing protein n=1 Tax=Colletotrichum shisoi TaxID=2078593 RepID=A0A5Q4BCH4_9PEZI|nr:hypothetical protein CSHISOI_10890 [Colletotrichum shisoi]
MPQEYDNLLPGLSWRPDNRGDGCFQRTDWKALCQIASHNNGEIPCEPLQHYAVGGSSLARLIRFQDGNCWVARIQLEEPTPDTSQKLRTELDTMFLLIAQTKAPVPRIFAFELDGKSTRSAFVLLEFLPGNNATDQARDYERIDWGLIPLQNRLVFYRTMAAAQVQIASARLPQIGSVIRNKDGSFSVGPIPGIGGPFKTAASFICAWATKATFPLSEAELRNEVPTEFVEEIIEGTSQFPSRLAGLARSGKHFTREGPFPIRHPDLFHSNVIVTEAYKVIGVIDWENSYAVPRELVDTPWFLSTVPRLMNRPENYNTIGRPLNKDESRKWADEEHYTGLVRDAELDADADHYLSEILANRNSRDMAAAFHLFSQGKIGLSHQTRQGYIPTFSPAIRSHDQNT